MGVEIKSGVEAERADSAACHLILENGTVTWSRLERYQQTKNSLCSGYGCKYTQIQTKVSEESNCVTVKFTPFNTEDAHLGTTVEAGYRSRPPT